MSLTTPTAATTSITQDKAFIMSANELFYSSGVQAAEGKRYDYFDAASKSTALMSGLASNKYLKTRTMYRSGTANTMVTENSSGSLQADSCRNDGAIVPAFCL